MSETMATTPGAERAVLFCPDFVVVGVVKGGTTALYNL